MTSISNSEDVIDSRDVIARIEELSDERQGFVDAAEDEDSPTEDREAAALALVEWDDSEEAEELKALAALAEQASGYAADWEHGETLIRDSYFKEYAMELADDIGAINSDAGWPNNCIDWDKAARELRMDYTAVEFGRVTYWVR